MVNNQVIHEFQIDNLNPAWFPPQFSPHGETLLYVALKDGKFRPVAGDWEGPTFDFIQNPQFSANGTIIAYSAVQSGKSFVVVGDRTYPSGDGFLGHGEFAISSNGSEVAYIANEIAGSLRKETVVYGEWRSPTYVSEWRHVGVLDYLTLSSDGDELMYSVLKGKKSSVVLHGKHEAEYEGVRFALLSPDGNSCAFHMKKDGKYYIVVNGRSGPAFDHLVDPLEFSSDSTRLAIFARVGNKVLIMCGDRRGPEYDLVSSPVVRFSADSASIGYTAWIGNELWWKTLDLR